MVIVRSPSALLGTLPGYRDMLRGSDINAFANLERLRIFLPDISARQLTLAGMHAGGEPELMRAAERVAASRAQSTIWRGGSALRGTAWIDGSGYDRGLAVHGNAFLIGPRGALPRLLGDEAPGERVAELSKTRRGVLLLLELHAVDRYLPALQPCGLQSLRISVSVAQRLSVRARYASASQAAEAGTCLTRLSGASSELRLLRELLGRASPARHDELSLLNTGVTHEEIARLLDELCWSLRRITGA